MKKIIESIPESWTVTELIQCFDLSIGGANIASSEYSESGTPVVLKSDVQPLCKTIEPTKYVPQKIVAEKYLLKTLMNDDLLLCMRDLSQKAQILGLITASNERQKGFLVAQGVTILRGCKVNGKFISYFSNSNSYRKYILQAKRGSTQVHLGNDDIFKLALPLPPLLEQNRIVAKIESTQEKIKTIEENVSKAEELIGKYRESLLQKAFRGQLVPQDPNDEPASELLKRIRAERAQATDSKKKKKEDLPPISEDEIPFEIPKSWEWVRLGDLISTTQLGIVRSTDEQKEDYRYHYLKMGDYDQQGNIEYSGLSKVNVSKEELEQFSLTKDDFIFNTRNSEKLVGKVTVIGADKPACLVFNNNLMRIRFWHINPKYIFWQFQSKTVQSQLNNFKSGTTSVSAIYGRDLVKTLIALPPIKEQIQIVAAIEQSINKTSSILSQFKAIYSEGNRLTTSILEHAFCGRLMPQDPKEGTGHDLLAEITSEFPNNQTRPTNCPTKSAKKKSNQ